MMAIIEHQYRKNLSKKRRRMKKKYRRWKEGAENIMSSGAGDMVKSS